MFVKTDSSHCYQSVYISQIEEGTAKSNFYALADRVAFVFKSAAFYTKYKISHRSTSSTLFTPTFYQLLNFWMDRNGTATVHLSIHYFINRIVPMPVFYFCFDSKLPLPFFIVVNITSFFHLQTKARCQLFTISSWLYINHLFLSRQQFLIREKRNGNSISTSYQNSD